MRIQHQTLALLVSDQGVIETHLLTATETPLKMGLLLRLLSYHRNASR